jgi:hypothetical protein
LLPLCSEPSLQHILVDLFRSFFIDHLDAFALSFARAYAHSFSFCAGSGAKVALALPLAHEVTDTNTTKVNFAALKVEIAKPCAGERFR